MVATLSLAQQSKERKAGCGVFYIAGRCLPSTCISLPSVHLLCQPWRCSKSQCHKTDLINKRQNNIGRKRGPGLWGYWLEREDYELWCRKTGHLAPDRGDTLRRCLQIFEKYRINRYNAAKLLIKTINPTQLFKEKETWNNKAQYQTTEERCS